MGSLLIPKHRVNWIPKETGDLKTFLSPQSESPWPSGTSEMYHHLREKPHWRPIVPSGTKRLHHFIWFFGLDCLVPFRPLERFSVTLLQCPVQFSCSRSSHRFVRLLELLLYFAPWPPISCSFQE